MATVSQVTEAVFRSRFEDQMSAGAEAARQAVERLGAQVSETEQRVTRSERSAKGWVSSADEITQAARKAERAKRDLANAEKALADGVARGEITSDQAARALATLSNRSREAEERLRALQRMNSAAGESMRLTGRELQQLSPQIADMAVQLAGGTSPLLVLIQQGPQMADAVGGIGRAFALLRASINPVAAAAVVATAAVAGAAIAAETHARALNGLSNRLRTTRNDYEALARTVDETARRMAASSSLSTADARSAGQVIAGSRGFAGSAADLEQLVGLSNRLAIVMGSTAPEAAARLAEALDKPAAAARKLADEGLRTMDESLVRTIQRLENQGRVAEANRLVIEALDRAAGDMAKTPLQRAMDELSQAFTQLWQALSPVVEAIGSALAAGLALVVRRVTALVEGLASIARFLTDNRLTRFLFGEGAPAAAAAAEPANDRVNRAMALVQQINPRQYQRENVQDQLRQLGDALPGATPDQARAIRDAMRELRAQLEGMAGPTAEFLRGLQQQGDLARYAEGAARELAQAQQQVDEAARQEGRAHASVAERAEARRLVQRRLLEELNTALVAANEQVNWTDRVADAYLESARAGAEAEIAQRAWTEALRYGAEGSEEHERATRSLTASLTRQAEAQARLTSARALQDQRNQLELIRREAELVGASVDVRERELAILRERQRILQDPHANIDSPENQRRLSMAAQIADETRALQQQQSSWNELARIGEQAFDRIGGAITEAFANGSLKAVDFKNIAKAVFSEVIQAGLRMAVLNPILNSIFGGTRATLGGLGAPSVGGGAPAAGGGMTMPGVGGPGGASMMPGWWNTPIFGPNAATNATWGQAIGAGVQTLGYGYGIYSGVQRGGLGGGVQAVGNAAALALMMTPAAPLAPFVALGSTILGSILPGQKPSNKEGNATLDLADYGIVQGGQMGSKFSQENRDAASQIVEQIATLDAKLEEALGVVINGSLNVGVGNRDGIYLRMHGVGGGSTRYDRSEAGVQKLLQDAALGLVDSARGQLAGDILQVVNASGRNSEKLLENLDWFTQVYQPLTEAAEPLDAFEEALKQLNQTYDDAVKKAKELGLAETALEEGRARAIEQLEQQRVEAAAPTATAVITSLADYVAGLQAGSLSPLSPRAQLVAAQGEFDRLFQAAQGGDFDALARLQGAAGTLLNLGQEVEGSGAGFAALFERVTSALGTLGTSLDEDKLTASIFAREQKSNTEILRAELVRLNASMERLQAQVRQNGMTPARLAA
jgi:hypothetical protein